MKETDKLALLICVVFTLLTVYAIGTLVEIRRVESSIMDAITSMQVTLSKQMSNEYITLDNRIATLPIVNKTAGK